MSSEDFFTHFKYLAEMSTYDNDTYVNLSSVFEELDRELSLKVTSNVIAKIKNLLWQGLHFKETFIMYTCFITFVTCYS